MNDDQSPNGGPRGRMLFDILRQCFIFFLGAVCVGGAAIVFFATSKLSHWSLRELIHVYPLAPLVLAPLGFALIAYITNTFFISAVGSGVPQTIAAFNSAELSTQKGLLSLPIAVAKIAMTGLGQICGASVGREGPMVQVGACVMHAFGRFMPAGRMSKLQLNRSLIVAGGAAGVAGAFTTPLTGVIFGLEQLSRSIESRTSAATVLAVAIAVPVVVTIAGEYGYFGRTAVALQAWSDWGAVLACGVVGGLLGGIFGCGIVQSPRIVPASVVRLKKSFPILFPAACGLCVGVLGVLSNGATYGNGSRETQLLLQNPDSLPFTFSILKLLATFFSCFSGIPGGLFAPSLGVGAGIGANVAALMPYAPSAAIVLIGITAYFSGVFQAPITGVVVVLEMAGNHALALPLIAAAVIATGISRLLCPRPIYQIIADRLLEAERVNTEVKTP
ncbi:MAG TPA: chloride channel protein [Burkholderiales bacterium]|nr:chloride channel protein [Burkholderiales bacterium]